MKKRKELLANYHDAIASKMVEKEIEIAILQKKKGEGNNYIPRQRYDLDKKGTPIPVMGQEPIENAIKRLEEEIKHWEEIRLVIHAKYNEA